MNDTPVPPVRRRLAAEERRSQILAAARKLFIEEGVEKTSMRRIASLAGVTPTLIYHHFADKEALLLTVCQAFFRGLIEANEAAIGMVPDEDEPFARLRRQLEGYVRFGLANRDVYRLVFMTPLASLVRSRLPAGHRPHDDAPPEDLGFGTQAFGMLEGEIARLIASGHLKSGDPAAIAEVVWATGHGLVSLMITHGDFKWTPFEQLLSQSIDTILNGIAA
ncbi:TetR/AcrR family transcriptional regulator [Zavarzinia sp.]|uniref:TetR/AcrR family transcriptional regulator n=1 Tax=Zavarzinia sp. TaxID=2027920 RepID=UPI003BB616BE|nr:TetR/AcrR family transcriptional regulator [Zavarzinia sp.]